MSTSGAANEARSGRLRATGWRKKPGRAQYAKCVDKYKLRIVRFGMGRRHNYRRYNKLYRLVADDDICVYCGVPADTLDHFVPLSILPMVGEVYGRIGRQFLVPACKECNCTAGSKVFKTVGAKRRYIQSRLRAKNRSLLSTPYWSEAEVAALGYNLAIKISQSAIHKTWIEARLRWRNTSNKDAVSIARIRSGFRVTGSASARLSAG
jgi:5-methylcytosine-specific restriction endonuclease McrA